MKYDHVEMSYGIVIYMDDKNMELEEEGEIVEDESSMLSTKKKMSVYFP